MADGDRLDDRRDCQQWHAVPPFCHFCCWSCSWRHHNHISRFDQRFSILHCLLINTPLGLFALYTAFALVDFKLNHPDVHNMGDAGGVLGGPILREVFTAGAVVFSICATGSQLLAGQVALRVLSDNRLCLLLATGKDRFGSHGETMQRLMNLGIFAVPTLLVSFPRTLDRLSWLSVPACICILVAGIAGMAAAGSHSAAGRQITVANSSNFYEAFVSITSPIFAFAGHLTFFTMISEMRRPADARKAACALQIFATM